MPHLGVQGEIDDAVQVDGLRQHTLGDKACPCKSVGLVVFHDNLSTEETTECTR